MRLPIVLASLLSTVAARYYSIAAPKTIKPGEPFEVILIGDLIYIQSVDDVAVAFGIDEGIIYPRRVGQTVLGSFYLGPEHSNKAQNITFSLNMPADITTGDASLHAALFSLWGVYHSPGVITWTAFVKIGNETSDEFVRGEIEI